MRKNDILIVEDSLATSILIAEFLKKLGYKDIHTCNTGKAEMQLFSIPKQEVSRTPI